MPLTEIPNIMNSWGNKTMPLFLLCDGEQRRKFWGQQTLQKVSKQEWVLGKSPSQGTALPEGSDRGKGWLIQRLKSCFFGSGGWGWEIHLLDMWQNKGPVGGVRLFLVYCCSYAEMGKPCLLETQKETSVFINKMILCLEFTSKSEKSCCFSNWDEDPICIWFSLTLDLLSFTNGYFYKIVTIEEKWKT